MKTGLFFHNCFLAHDTGLTHPECSDRLVSIVNGLSGKNFEDLERIEAPEASLDHIELVHPRSHIDYILKSFPDEGFRNLDADTILSPGSKEACLRAPGAVVEAVKAVFDREIGNAFCLVRPPGHHAEPSRAMGFCVFNNIAIGAAYALRILGLKRIAIIDIDVHHGNGTEKWAEKLHNCLFFSIHQYPLYPGTGLNNNKNNENICNYPINPGSSFDEYSDIFEKELLPKLAIFKPEIIFVSCGFDAHYLDPLANINLNDQDYGSISRLLTCIAGKHCGGKLVSVLEGGYNLKALEKSVSIHVSELMSAAMQIK